MGVLLYFRFDNIRNLLLKIMDDEENGKTYCIFEGEKIIVLTHDNTSVILKNE